MDVNGFGMSKVRTRGLRSSIRDKGCEYVSCQTSVRVSGGFAGKSGSFRLPQHHGRVNINFLTSGVATRLQL
jgi:hypothetical protein